MKTKIIFSLYVAQFFLEREMFQSNVVEKIKTHILCSVTFFLNGAVYEVMQHWFNERSSRIRYSTLPIYYVYLHKCK